MNASLCPHCGKSHPVGAKFCPSTGKPLQAAAGTQSLSPMLIYILGTLALAAVVYLLAGGSRPNAPAALPSGVAPAFEVPTFDTGNSVAPAPTQYVVPAMPTAAPAAPVIAPASTQPPISANAAAPTDLATFVRWYFNSVWQDRDFATLWDTYLTPAFQASSSPGGFNEYATWWGSVDRVDVLGVNVTQNDGHFASVDVHLTLNLRNGQVLNNRDYQYDLVFDSMTQTWMFDYR